MEDLFSKELPVTVKYKNDREDRRTNLHLSIYIDTIVAPVARKDLVVRLTEEQDLFFLYTLRLNEEDFQVLKVQQGLLVDFGAFPQKFIQLLELAIAEKSKDIPKFIIDLYCISSGTPSACLNVIETNAFKHLTHLSLKLLPGCDKDIKDYLASCLKDYKFENEKLRMRAESSEAELGGALADARASLAEKSRLLETAESDWSKRLSDVSCEAANSVNEERKKTQQEKSDLLNKMDREKRVSEEQSNRSIRDLQDKLGKVDLSNKDLTDTKYRSESSLRELALKLSTLEEEHRRCRGDVVSSRREVGRLEGVVGGLETSAAQSRTRLAVLDQELKDKDKLLTKTSELLQLEKEHKTRGEEDVDRRRKQVHKLEGSVKKMSDELIKGNEIIKRLQTDIKGYHNKLKVRSQVIAEQEKLLAEKARDIDEYKRTADDSRRILDSLKDDNKKFAISLETARKQIEDDKEVLKTNENVISWLNKQVTESQLAGVTYSSGRIPITEILASSRPVHGGTITNTIANSLSQSSISPYGPIPKAQVQFAVPMVGQIAVHAPVALQTGLAPNVCPKPHSSLKTMVPLAKSSPIVDEQNSMQRQRGGVINTPLGTSPILQQSAGLNLDSKYLQKSGQITNNSSPLSQLYPHQPIKVGKSNNSATTVNQTRINKETNVPLMSAYFPR